MIGFRFRPSIPNLIYLGGLLLITLAVSLLSNTYENAMFILYALFLVFSIACIRDFLRVRHSPQLAIKRIVPNNVSLHRWQNVEVIFRNTSATKYTFTFSEHIPDTFEIEGRTKKLIINANEEALVAYRVKPNKRGEYVLNHIELCLHSPFGLWHRIALIPLSTVFKVYPDFSRIRSSESLNGIGKQSIVGLKLRKKRGDGIEFHQLRDFRDSDSIRQIDWQATSKRQKLISKEYQEEQNQHVVVMLDAGQRMKIETQFGSHFDAALNALLMLSHTVLKQGDWFSMQSFGLEERWLANVKGAQNVSRVMNHFYDLYPDECASDYTKASNNLLSKRNKRALVLLVTSLNDHDLHELLPAIRQLQKRHLVALINIENQGLKDALNMPIESNDDANAYCSALALQNQYKQNTQRLRKENVICVDSKPESLLPYMINTYLNVKQSGLL